MGYCIDLVKCNFHIKRANVAPAFEAIMREMSNEGYRWIDKGWKDKVFSLQEALKYWLYKPTINPETGDITSLTFIADKLGDEKELFKVIAPYVEPGSYLKIAGEDGCVWYWNFDGKSLSAREVD